jgi:hypothetical protein
LNSAEGLPLKNASQYLAASDAGEYLKSLEGFSESGVFGSAGYLFVAKLRDYPSHDLHFSNLKAHVPKEMSGRTA